MREYNFSKIIKFINKENSLDILHIFSITYCAKRPLFEYDDILEKIVDAEVNKNKFSLDGTDFIKNYYKAILSKQYDYRSECEWRLLIENKNQGLYDFPYINRLFLGKNINQYYKKSLISIAHKLNVSVFIQTINTNGNNFIYTQL